MTDLCPVCEIGALSPSTWQHKGLELECYKCCECGADPVFEDQIQRNHERLKMTDQQDITRVMSELDQLRLNYIESLQGENKRLHAELNTMYALFESWWLDHHDNSFYFNEIMRRCPAAAKRMQELCTQALGEK